MEESDNDLEIDDVDEVTKITSYGFWVENDVENAYCSPYSN